MKTCRNCKKEFPFIVIINKLKHNLKNRKYCLDCSPLGSHNTRALTSDKEGIKSSKYSQPQSKFKNCSLCKKQLPNTLEYFYARKNRLDTSGYCKQCTNSEALKRISETRRKIKQKCLELSGEKCIICGYFKCHWSLVFHHLDPSKKEIQISATKTFEKSFRRNKKMYFGLP